MRHLVKRTGSGGFTLLELLVVIAVIATVAAIAIPSIAASRQTVYRVDCANNRRIIEQAEGSFYLHEGRHSDSLEELVEMEYLNRMYHCRAGGVYTWLDEDGYPPQTILVCSVHGYGETGEQPEGERTPEEERDIERNVASTLRDFLKSEDFWRSPASALLDLADLGDDVGEWSLNKVKDHTWHNRYHGDIRLRYGTLTHTRDSGDERGFRFYSYRIPRRNWNWTGVYPDYSTWTREEIRLYYRGE